VLGAGVWGEGRGARVEGSRLRGLGFRSKSSGFRVDGFGVRVQAGLGFRGFGTLANSNNADKKALTMLTRRSYPKPVGPKAVTWLQGHLAALSRVSSSVFLENSWSGGCG